MFSGLGHSNTVSEFFLFCNFLDIQRVLFDEQGIGHGISASFLDKIRQVSREFFNQPMEEKNKYAKSVVDVHGYGADPVPEQGQSLDWSDRLFLEVFPEDRRQYNLWPQIPISFR